MKYEAEQKQQEREFQLRMMSMIYGNHSSRSPTSGYGNHLSQSSSSGYGNHSPSSVYSQYGQYPGFD